MTARWEDSRYNRKPGRLERALDRLAERIEALPTDPLADAVRREAMLAHPSNQGATAGEAPRPTHGTAGRGANHRHNDLQAFLADEMQDPEFAAAYKAATANEVRYNRQRSSQGPVRLNLPADNSSLAESPSRTALGVTVAFLAMLALVLAAVSCDPNPATSLGCADDSCEVAP